MPEVIATAPGRVNLIGEHTDYHEGFVMPCAVPQRTTATLRPRPDRQVHATSAQRPGEVLRYELRHETPRRDWGDYVQGVTHALAVNGLRTAGFDLHLDSTVPLGSGLSSSAALEIAVLRALREAFSLPLDDLALARIGRQAETDFVGAPVGIMDQVASSIGREREALFLDTRTLQYERLPFPDSLELAVIDSGVAHQHAGGGYVTRRAESEAAARLLGVRCLRDLDESALPQLLALPDVEARRARHVITENARVERAAAALRAGDLETFGRLLVASHASMRDDYEISTPEIDLLVDIAVRQPGVFGARMTGGGFGGAVVLAARAGQARPIATAVLERYQQLSNRSVTILIPNS
jgi:galactokinase